MMSGTVQSKSANTGEGRLSKPSLFYSRDLSDRYIVHFASQLENIRYTSAHS